MSDKIKLENFILRTIHTFNEFILKLENDFLPEIHKITSVDEINDVQTVIKEFIIDDIKLIFKEWDIPNSNNEPIEPDDISNHEVLNTSSDNSINNNIIDITDLNNDSEENEKKNVLNDDDIDVNTHITIEENDLIHDEECKPNHSNSKENEIEKNKENIKIDTNDDDDDDDENTNITGENHDEKCKLGNDNIGSVLESDGISNIRNDTNTNVINQKRKRTITIDGINENVHKNDPNDTITQNEGTNNTVFNELNIHQFFNRDEECIVSERIVKIENENIKEEEQNLNENINSEDVFNTVDTVLEPVYTMSERITVKSIDRNVEDDLESILNENSMDNNSQHSINENIRNCNTNNQINKSPPPSRKLNSDFVDTVTSVSDFKNYNTNIKKTLIEKVRNFLEQMPSEFDSWETDYIPSLSNSIDTDDCLSSISNRCKNKTKQKYQCENINEENSTPIVTDKEKENNSKNINSDDTYKENSEQVKNVVNGKDSHHDNFIEDDSTDANFDLLNTNKSKEDFLDERNESEILISRDETKKLENERDIGTNKDTNTCVSDEEMEDIFNVQSTTQDDVQSISIISQSILKKNVFLNENDILIDRDETKKLESERNIATIKDSNTCVSNEEIFNVQFTTQDDIQNKDIAKNDLANISEALDKNILTNEMDNTKKVPKQKDHSESIISRIKQDSISFIDSNSSNSNCSPIIVSQQGNFYEDDVKEELIPSLKVEVELEDGESANKEEVERENYSNYIPIPELNTFEASVECESPNKEVLENKNSNQKTINDANTKNLSTAHSSFNINKNKKRKKNKRSSDCKSVSQSSQNTKHEGSDVNQTPKRRTDIPNPNAEVKNHTDKINNLTNTNNFKRNKSQKVKKPVKRKRNKKPSLADFYNPNECDSFSSIDSSQTNQSNNKKRSQNTEIKDQKRQEELIRSLKTTNRYDVEDLTRKRLLESDDDDDVRIIKETPSKKRKSVPCISLDEDDKPDEIKKSSESSKKPIDIWKKDPLLNFSLNNFKNGEIKKEITNKMRTLKKKIELKNNVVDDDVQSVCSSFQERVTNPKVREHLQKLVNNIDEIVSAINKDNEDEVTGVPSSDDDDDDVDLVDSPVLDEENASHLDLKFRKTARKRRGRAMRLQRRAEKLLPVIIEPSTQDLVPLEDRFQGESPVVLDVDEETGNIVSVCNFYSKVLKNHQKRGVQFMWDTCFGSMRKLREEDGSGCILAHDMGLGKSLEVIALLHTLRKLNEPSVSKILLLCPKSLVQNWEDEVNKWTKGFHTKLPVYSWKSDKNQTVCDLHQWSANGGIYVLVYQMFRSICKRKEMYNVDERDVDWTTFFLDPGPDILICDEAHLVKNCRSEIYKSLLHIRTNRRIALTGTPIQNNLEELYNLVKFVQPNFMNKEKFRDQFIYPISLGQEAKANRDEKNKANERIVVLHKELEKVIDREQGSNQEVGLPSRINYDIILNLTDIQKKIYQYYCNKMKDSFEQTMMFAAVRIAENIVVHPKSLEASKRVVELKNKIDDSNKGNEWHDDFKGDWWKNVLSPNELHDWSSLESGVKALITFKIIERAAERNEKVLIFCNSLEILNVFQTYLEQHKYEKNVNYFRLDGSVPIASRIKYVNTFNNEKNTNAKVFLLTHKVGGVGLNFTGANRIVIIDMPWNPSYHEQSSNRTHRIGQKKTSFVYRLITKGTIEEKIYKTTVSKQSLSKRVVDKKKIKSLFRERDIFNFDYQEGMTLRRNLPSAKDDLLNYLIQNDKNKIIHSYLEQGELFELSEEQFNEAKAYEDYLNESTLPKELGEKKKQRRRKSQIQDEPVVDRMLSNDIIQNYDHTGLLNAMQQNTSGPYPRYSNPSQSNFIPYNHANINQMNQNYRNGFTRFPNYYPAQQLQRITSNKTGSYANVTCGQPQNDQINQNVNLGTNNYSNQQSKQVYKKRKTSSMPPPLIPIPKKQKKSNGNSTLDLTNKTSIPHEPSQLTCNNMGIDQLDYEINGNNYKNQQNRTTNNNKYVESNHYKSLSDYIKQNFPKIDENQQAVEKLKKKSNIQIFAKSSVPEVSNTLNQSTNDFVQPSFIDVHRQVNEHYGKNCNVDIFAKSSVPEGNLTQCSQGFVQHALTNVCHQHPPQTGQQLENKTLYNDPVHCRPLFEQSSIPKQHLTQENNQFEYVTTSNTQARKIDCKKYGKQLNNNTQWNTSINAKNNHYGNGIAQYSNSIIMNCNNQQPNVNVQYVNQMNYNIEQRNDIRVAQYKNLSIINNMEQRIKRMPNQTSTIFNTNIMPSHSNIWQNDETEIFVQAQFTPMCDPVIQMNNITSENIDRLLDRSKLNINYNQYLYNMLESMKE